MLPRWVRHVFMTAIAVGAWLMVAPAYAAGSAPFCDDRGAIMFAPTPTLQVPAASIDVSELADECFLEARVDHSVQRGRTPAPLPAPFETECVVPASLAVPAPSCLRAEGRPVARDGSLVGERRTIRRPPR